MIELKRLYQCDWCGVGEMKASPGGIVTDKGHWVTVRISTIESGHGADEKSWDLCAICWSRVEAIRCSAGETKKAGMFKKGALVPNESGGAK